MSFLQVLSVWQQLRYSSFCNYYNKMWSLPYRKPVENGGRDGSLAGGILGRFCKRYTEFDKILEKWKQYLSNERGVLKRCCAQNKKCIIKFKQFFNWLLLRSWNWKLPFQCIFVREKARLMVKKKMNFSLEFFFIEKESVLIRDCRQTFPLILTLCAPTLTKWSNTLKQFVG